MGSDQAFNTFVIDHARKIGAVKETLPEQAITEYAKYKDQSYDDRDEAALIELQHQAIMKLME